MNHAARIAQLGAQLGGPRDGALLRFSLGSAWLEAGDAARAAEAFAQAVAFDPGYSAAWKLLGKARLAQGDPAGAAEAWRHGIEAAHVRGDKQAEKEMAVFLRRIERGDPAPPAAGS